MKKNIVTLAFAAGLLVLPTTVFAAPPGQWFVGGQIGQSKLQGMSADHDSDTGYAFSGGYLWQVNPEFEIGPEIGYVALGTYSDKLPASITFAGNVKAKVKGAFAGVNARFFFSPNWYAQLQGGYFNAHSQIDIHTYDPFVPSASSNSRDTSTKSTWYTGVGFGYRFNNNTSLGFVFNHFDDKTGNYDLGSSLASIRVEFQF